MAKAELLVSFLLCISAVHAVDHVVGGNNGWTEILVDYTEWAAGEKFVAGDKLIFNYDTIHNVVELDKDNYDNCLVPGSTPSYTGGETTISLTLPGTRYFICSISDHCTGGGMKLTITVEAGTSNDTTPPSPSPQSTPPSDIPLPPSPLGTPPSDIPLPPSPLGTPPSDIGAPSPSVTPPSDTSPSNAPLVPPSDSVPTPSPSETPPSDIFPPSPNELPPADIPPTATPPPPPPPSAGTFGGMNSLLIGFSLISATLFCFMG